MSNAAIDVLVARLVDSLTAVLDSIAFTTKDVGGGSFKLGFTADGLCFELECSLHHLDMPWHIAARVTRAGSALHRSVAEVVGRSVNDPSEPPYQVTPIILSDPSKMAGLADALAADIQRAITALRQGAG